LLEKLLAAPVGQNVGWPLTPALLRLDPLWGQTARTIRGFGNWSRTPDPGRPPRHRAVRPALSDPQLQRAAQLLGTDATMTDVGVAEDLVKGVLAAHRLTSRATVLMGRIQDYVLIRGYDRSGERVRPGRQFAERGPVVASR